ncbi:MAG: SIS domain-containing protein [Polyangiaceae bacterium]
MITLEGLFTSSLRASIALKQEVLASRLSEMECAARLLLEAYQGGNKALFFGNGGSAADAQHLAAEMEGRFILNRKPLPALALHTNASTMTALANDFSYDEVFARLLIAHGRPGDVAIGFSTSGTSKNVVAAAKVVRDLGLRFIAFTGENGAILAPFADVVIAVPSRDTARIQEVHILLGHVLCEYVERSLFAP